MQVFGLPLSPFVRKVHVVAAEKGIPIEVVPANPRDPSPEFLAASPFRKIPALKDGDFLLADSSAIVTYFEALVPEPAILPAEPRARAKAVWFEEVCDTIVAPAGAKLVFNRFVAPRILGMPGNEEAAAQGEAELAPILDWIESQVLTEGWLVGGDFSLGDIALASLLKTLSFVDKGCDRALHPRTAAWFDRVTARPAWRQVQALEDKLSAQFA
jgi:glutathione S-transferase